MATNEDMQKQYIEMINKFKQQCEDSLKGQTNAWNELLESGQKNFVTLQQNYAKGHQELLVQMKKANAEMIEKLTKNYSELKDSINQAYANLMNQSKTNFDKNIASFRQTCEDAMKKVTALSPKVYQDTIKELQTLHGVNVESIQKSFKSMMTHLDNHFQETVKQLKLPEISTAKAEKAEKPRK